MIDAELMLKLWEIFPAAFSYSKRYRKTEVYAGRFGTEEIAAGDGMESLAESILYTAAAISRGGKYMDKAIAYLESFRGEKVQASVIKSFTR